MSSQGVRFVNMRMEISCMNNRLFYTLHKKALWNLHY
jgi:hypothetical protein